LFSPVNTMGGAIIVLHGYGGHARGSSRARTTRGRLARLHGTRGPPELSPASAGDASSGSPHAAYVRKRRARVNLLAALGHLDHLHGDQLGLSRWKREALGSATRGHRAAVVGPSPLHPAASIDKTETIFVDRNRYWAGFAINRANLTVAHASGRSAPFSIATSRPRRQIATDRMPALSSNHNESPASAPGPSGLEPRPRAATAIRSTDTAMLSQATASPSRR
jgi:hypothetical protein